MNAELEARTACRRSSCRTPAHELKTPLTSIIANTEVLEYEMCGPVNEEQRRVLTNISRNSQHLLRMISRLLAFASQREGGDMLRLQEASVPMLLESVRRDRPAAPRGGRARGGSRRGGGHAPLQSGPREDLPRVPEPGRERDQVLASRGDPRRRRASWTESWRAASGTRGSGSRPTCWKRSSDRSVRWTPPRRGATRESGSGSRSAVTWSSSTAGGSGPNPKRAAERRSASVCRATAAGVCVPRAQGVARGREGRAASVWSCRHGTRPSGCPGSSTRSSAATRRRTR